MSDNTTPQRKKTTLKLVLPPKSSDLRLGGTAPGEDMGPGKYLVTCETAWIESVGREHRAVLQFRVVDGKYDGVALRQWVTAANGGGVISPTSRYARYCTLALGRPLESDDPVNDPGQIFSGSFFLVQIGYRKTEHARGGKFSEEAALRRKDTADYLRVHEILERVER